MAFRRLHTIDDKQRRTPSSEQVEAAVKTLISILVVASFVAVTGAAFAGDVTKTTTKAACEKAGGDWTEASAARAATNAQ